MKRVYQLFIVLLAAVFLSGCSKGKLAEKDARIATLERELQEARTKLENQKNDFRDAQRRKMEEWSADCDQKLFALKDERTMIERELRLEVASLKKQALALEGRLKAAEKAALPPAPQPVVAATATEAVPVTPPPPVAPVQVTPRIVEVPRVPVAAVNPVTVSSVLGETIVSGVHTTTTYEATGETVKDRYGKETPVTRPVQVPVEQFEYRVSFTAENTTGAALEFSARAGIVSKVFRLAPGEKAEFNVPSAKGASLQVGAAGSVQSFEVKY